MFIETMTKNHLIPDLYCPYSLRRSRSPENMWYFAIILTVLGNVLYHVAQKSIPSATSPFVSLLITYTISIAITAISLPFDASQLSFRESIQQLNWGSVAVGISIFAVEIGYLLAYRAGWQISTGALFTYVVTSLLLFPAGALFFHERISWINGLGALLCMSGLILVLRK